MLIAEFITTTSRDAGSELARLEYRHDKWDPALAAHLKKLEQTKPVIATGDFNCARHPLDIHNARNNVKSAGFTPQERASFEKVRRVLAFCACLLWEHQPEGAAAVTCCSVCSAAIAMQHVRRELCAGRLVWCWGRRAECRRLRWAGGCPKAASVCPGVIGRQWWRSSR